MFKHLRLRLLVLAGSCLFFSGSAYADPISITLDENASGFTFRIVGTAVDHDFTYGLLPGHQLGIFWRIDFELEEDDGPIDQLSILRFTFQHLQGFPGGPAGPLSFQPTTVMAAVSGDNLVVFTVSELHSNELDRAVGLLRFHVTDNQITGYSFEVNGQHAVSEPVTLILFGTGLVGVAIKKMRNKRR
ncbi:MAG TPA: hypothetical protein VJ306_17190 [Pyrinomonadaceae bacterium]|jgi:hypothetical protein|nr:hypothetical protein [Pyrinomonadaceae bacterium]